MTVLESEAKWDQHQVLTMIGYNPPKSTQRKTEKLGQVYEFEVNLRLHEYGIFHHLMFNYKVPPKKKIKKIRVKTFFKAEKS